MENEENQDIDLENNEETVEETTTETVEEDTTDWKAQALKFKAIAERQKRKVSKPITRKEDDLTPIKDTVQKLELAEKKRQFGYDHNLSPEETDQIFRINPNPNKEDLDTPFVKGGLEALRAKKRVELGTPSPSSSSPIFNGKTFEELSPEEKQANWATYVKSKAKK